MIHVVNGAADERAKYEEIWRTVPEYRDYSPGLVNVDRFMSVMKPRTGSSLIDVGAGACVAGLKFKELGIDAWFLDITAAAVPPEVPDNRFIEAPLWSEWGVQQKIGWDYGFCCDVMEHIPPEYTMLCVDRVLSYCRTAWFQIALRPDEFGKKIGQPLHLTVQPYQWWLLRISTLGEIIDARDLCGDGLYVVTR